jgi:HAD superfamily hydrolase (TIGR01490 family)
MPIAFFDLDRTLLPVNSAWLWIVYELEHGYLNWRQVAQASGWLTAYHLGIASLDRPLRAAIATYQGSPADELRSRTRDFYVRKIAGGFRPGGLRALKAHRDAGDSVVLLTTSSTYLSERVSEELELDGYLCNAFEEDESGRLTGRAIEPLCYGQGKVAAAVRFAAAHDCGLVDCTFYSDSLSDLPMLDAVGHPVVVAPDPLLRRLSQRRGWPMMSW